MNDESLKNEIKNSMDAIADGIDISTQVKLNEARHTALNQQPKRLSSTARWSLLGMAAAVVMVATVLITGSIRPSSGESDGVLFEDLEILANEADTDFYQDLEFLTWLDENNLVESDI